MRPSRLLCALATGFLVLAMVASASEKKALKQAEAALAEPYRQWLEVVFFLISDEEREAFLALEKDYQRDAFIERFWKIRDPYPDTARNEFREEWNGRVEYAVENFGNLREDRARYFLMNGPPTQVLEFNCTTVLWPLEAWFYDGSERVLDEFFLLFVRRMGGRQWTLWHPIDGIDELVENQSEIPNLARRLLTCRDGDVLLRILNFLTRGSGMDFEMLLARIERPRESPSGEWVATFTAYSTDMPEGAEPLAAELSIAFPERRQSRTVVQTAIRVPASAATASEFAGHHGYNFFLTGEVLRDGKLFENFRYKFDLPLAEIADDTIPLLFERRLRPGDYRLIVKLEDLNSKRVFRDERELAVPRLDGVAPAPDAETERILDAAQAVIGGDRPSVQIIAPHGEMHTGMVRFDTLVTGESVSEMHFSLDGRIVMRKRRPPFSVELDLGSVPRTHQLRAAAIDVDGNELAVDELTLNAGKHRFAVRLTEPRKGLRYDGEVEASAEVAVPAEKVLERVEFYLNETLLATLYQPPYVHRLALPRGAAMTYVEAVAYLPDGNSTRDGVFINGPDFVEEVDVEYVELYVTALDKQLRPVADLRREELTVLEDGVVQEIRRFERVDDLPIHAQVMIDVSASMAESLEATRRAALSFFRETITAKDRAALITFNDHPQLAVNFTNDVDHLAGGLAGLAAERGTALHDTLVFGLYHLNGIKGQRAILLLSDGKDESSRFSFETTLEYARRAGVAIYAIGLDIGGKNAPQARRNLVRFAEETGGRSFFIKNADELAGVYDAIEEELRSRYLVTYQSTNSSTADTFRAVDLQVTRGGVEAKTMRGYYP